MASPHRVRAIDVRYAPPPPGTVTVPAERLTYLERVERLAQAALEASTWGTPEGPASELEFLRRLDVLFSVVDNPRVPTLRVEYLEAVERAARRFVDAEIRYETTLDDVERAHEALRAALNARPEGETPDA